MVGEPVDDARRIAQAAQHLDDERQHLGLALAQALLLELFDLVLDGAQLGLGAAAVLHLASARHVQRDAVELQRHLHQRVAHEHQAVVAGQRAAQRRVVGVRGHQRVQEQQHVDEHVPDHHALAVAQALAAGQGAQHHVARGLVLVGHDGLALDQVAVGLVQVRRGVVEGGAGGDVVGGGEQRHRHGLLLFAQPEQARKAQAEHQVEQRAAQRGRGVRQHLVRLQRRMHGQRHQQQAGEADQPAALAEHAEHGIDEALRDDRQPDQHRIAGRQPRDDHGQGAQRRAAQHFVGTVALRAAGLVDDGQALRAEGRHQARRVIAEQAAHHQHGQQHPHPLAHPAEEVVAVEEAADAGDAQIHGRARFWATG